MQEEFYKLELAFGDRFEVTIYHADMLVYQNQVVYGKSFADVRIGQPYPLHQLSLSFRSGYQPSFFC